MILDLVRGDRRIAETRRLFHLRGVEIADADMAYLAGIPHLVQRADPFGHRHVAPRPVQKQQIDMVGPQLSQALIDRGDEGVVAIVVDPDLRGQEDVRPWNAGLLDGLADFRLVAVDLCGVDVAETELQGLRQDGSTSAPDIRNVPKPSAGILAPLELTACIENSFAASARRGRGAISYTCPRKARLQACPENRAAPVRAGGNRAQFSSSRSKVC